MQDKEIAAILQEEPMQPLALVPLTEEEQVCYRHVYILIHLKSKVVVLLDKCIFELAFLTLLPFALSILPWQRNFSMSVNSVAVLRLMGKGVGGAAPAGVVRGRGATRGSRGRG